jgi:enamine deaminase RidA (YjgF/YER057c/UK114 family)
MKAKGEEEKEMLNTTIERRNPDIGYMSKDVFEANAFTQTIRAGGTIYLSGIAPLRGSLKDIEVLGADLKTQIEWVLEVLKRCLAAEGLTLKNLVSVTVYVTAMDELVKLAPMFREYFGGYTPTSTWVEVRRLFHPQQMVEVSGVAVS